MTLEEVIAAVGLPAVFVGSAVEGDVTPFLAGVVSHLGALRLPLVVGAATLGTMAGDLGWYWLGRSRGDRIRESRLYRKAAPAVESAVDRIGVAQLFSARFVYGTRIASMIYWGVRGLPLPRFLAIELVSCLAWTTLLSGLGYALSDRAALVVGEIKAIELWLLGALVAGVGVAAARAWVADRRRQ